MPNVNPFPTFKYKPFGDCLPLFCGVINKRVEIRNRDTLVEHFLPIELISMGCASWNHTLYHSGVLFNFAHFAKRDLGPR